MNASSCIPRHHIEQKVHRLWPAMSLVLSLNLIQITATHFFLSFFLAASHDTSMADEDGDNPLSDNVVVLLIAMGSAAFVVSMYHVIAICLCHQRNTTDQNRPEQQQQHQPPATPSLDQSTSSSVAHLIPTHKYHKRKDDVDVHGGGGGGDLGGGTCAVCLGDFEEGEELRTMPECLHSFHVPCIDMWLHSHSSCPICRASAAPSPALNIAHDHTVDIITPTGAARSVMFGLPL